MIMPVNMESFIVRIRNNGNTLVAFNEVTKCARRLTSLTGKSFKNREDPQKTFFAYIYS